jgi:hypothetical protein
MNERIPLKDALDRLCREEQGLKKAGGFAEAAGVRLSVTILLRLADEGDESIEPSEDD